MPPDVSPCTSNTLTVSPDGKHIGWVRGSGKIPDSGTFMLADVDGGHPRTLGPDKASCLGATAIRWTEPGVVEGRGAETGGKLDFHVADGSPVGGDPGQEHDAAWSVTGSALAARHPDGSVYVTMTSDATSSRTIHYTPPAAEAARWDGWSPRSVSLDAAYVAVGWNGTDPSRRDDSFAILDAATSKPVSLPEKEIDHVEFLADGTVLVRAPHGTNLDILDSHFRLSRTIPLPAEVTDLRLVRYVG
jgi:hypothetical protein